MTMADFFLAKRGQCWIPLNTVKSVRGSTQFFFHPPSYWNSQLTVFWSPVHFSQLEPASCDCHSSWPWQSARAASRQCTCQRVSDGIDICWDLLRFVREMPEYSEITIIEFAGALLLNLSSRHPAAAQSHMISSDTSYGSGSCSSMSYGRTAACHMEKSVLATDINTISYL